MVSQVIMPKLGQTMEEGAIVEWIRKEGDPVSRGDLLFTVESDKAVLEVESTARGFLRKILVPEGQTVKVLTVVALITRTADEELPASSLDQPGIQSATAQPTTEPTALDAPHTPQQTEQAAAGQPAGRIFASPRARRSAREKGVDLALVSGTGPRGRIVEADVLAHHAARPKATPVARKTAAALGIDLGSVTATGAGGRITKTDVEAAAPAPSRQLAAMPKADTTPLTGLRRIIAERMADSHSTTARVTLVTEADATVLVTLREQLRASVAEEWGFAPGFNDLLCLVVARALGEFPYMNARYSEDGQAIDRIPYVNLGLAVDTDRGLLVPVIRNADALGLRALGNEFRALVERARAGKSLPDDLTGGTFTITNLGMYEVDAFTPIINLPEAAILGAGRIQSKPVVHDGQIVIREMWTLSLAFDHRLVDGAPAARFLQRIKHLVENPYLLLT
jgi:pyruvate dehydrogenase E2 component (dihydrolipoamide acetyltransferase)